MGWFSKLIRLFRSFDSVTISPEMERRRPGITYIFNTIRLRYPRIEASEAVRTAQSLHCAKFIWFKAHDGVLQIEANPHYKGVNLLGIGITLAKIYPSQIDHQSGN